MQKFTFAAVVCISALASLGHAVPGKGTKEHDQGKHGGHQPGYIDFGHSGFSNNNYYLGGPHVFGRNHGDYGQDQGSQGHGHGGYEKGHGQDDDGDYGKGDAYSYEDYNENYEPDGHDDLGKGHEYDGRRYDTYGY